jgi:ABC-2 type transport system permease protein
MMNFKKANTVAKYTFEELYKSKILLNSFFIGLALLLLTFTAYQFTYGEPERIALDFGLSCLSISSVGISLFLGVTLISKEIENRTVYMIISRPVKRMEFIFGKLIGFNFIVFLNVLILSLLTLSVYFISGGTFQSLILWSIFFILVESLVVLLLVVLFSLLTTNILAVFLTISLYLIGQVISETQNISFVQNSDFLSMFIKSYHFALPGFYKFNVKKLCFIRS